MKQPAYTTQHELRFVAEIADRNVLKGYLEGASKRADWGAIDAAAVIAAARSRLQAIEKRRRGR